jgi:hypothetical protein
MFQFIRLLFYVYVHWWLFSLFKFVLNYEIIFLFLDCSFVAGSVDINYQYVYVSGAVTVIYESCNITGIMASSSCGHGLFWFTTTNGAHELNVSNCTITNVRCGGSNYGLDSGLFKFSGLHAQSWYILEVVLIFLDTIFFLEQCFC